MPVRVTENIVNDLGGVLAGTGLEIQVRGGNEVQPLLDVLGGCGGRCIGSVGKIDDFQFVGTGKDNAGALFGRARNPVNARRERVCAVGLYAKAFACGAEGCDKRVVHLQGGFATREDNQYAGVVAQALHLGDYIGSGHAGGLGEIGIAKRTAQVATAETYKDCRLPRVVAFALKAEKYLVDFVHFGNEELKMKN